MGNSELKAVQPLDYRFGRQRQIKPQLGLLMNAATQSDGGRQQASRLFEKTVQLGHLWHPPCDRGRTMDQPPEGCQRPTRHATGAKSPHGRCADKMPPAIYTLALKNREQPGAEPMRSIVIFDLGGVLIDWDPRHLYRKLFAGDEKAMEQFLATVCTQEWNRCQDAGRSFAEGARLLKAEHPDKAELIDAYGARFDEMMAGPIIGAVEILAQLHKRGTPLYGLSNFSAETYPCAVVRFEFLGWFRGILVSGEVGAIKPDPRIYELLLGRFGIDPHRAVYIDDVVANAEAARPFGIHAIHFSTPDALREELIRLALL